MAEKVEALAARLAQVGLASEARMQRRLGSQAGDSNVPWPGWAQAQLRSLGAAWGRVPAGSTPARASGRQRAALAHHSEQALNAGQVANGCVKFVSPVYEGRMRLIRCPRCQIARMRPYEAHTERMRLCFIQASYMRLIPDECLHLHMHAVRDDAHGGSACPRLDLQAWPIS